MESQSGRTMTEVLMVVVIIGILSLGGLWYYHRSLEEQRINDLLNAIHGQVVLITSANMNQTFSSPQQMDEYLKGFATKTDTYIIEFHSIVGETPFSGENFVAEVRLVDGGMIKGAQCRRLLNALAEQKMTMDMSFSLKNEQQEDGSIKDVEVRLNDKIIEIDSLCGG